MSTPPPLLSYEPATDPWLTILHEDRDIIAVNKPSGLLSNPGRQPEHYDSVWSRVHRDYPKTQIVHRLDMTTSGLMILALTKDAERHLKAQFRERETHKLYYAWVWGELDHDQGSVNLPLICDWPNRPKQKVCFEEGKPSLTHYDVIKRKNGQTLVQLTPITGRSHQLRVHMLAIGHPIVGDRFYAPIEAQEAAPHLQLHSAELMFTHPYKETPIHLFAPCDFYPEAPKNALLNAPYDLRDVREKHTSTL